MTPMTMSVWLLLPPPTRLPPRVPCSFAAVAVGGVNSLAKYWEYAGRASRAKPTGNVVFRTSPRKLMVFFDPT